MLKKIDSYFEISKKNSTIGKELLAGFIVFLSMVYILPTTASILSDAGMDRTFVFFATAIASGFACVFMGIAGKYPIILSVGMGVNTFFAYTVCYALGYTWQEGLTIGFVSSVILIILTITKLREKIVNDIPNGLKSAITVALGFFIAFVGLKSGGLITSDASILFDETGRALINSTTIVKLGDFTSASFNLSMIGILLVFVFLCIKGKISNFAVIIALLITVGIGLVLGYGFGFEGMPKFDFDNKFIVADNISFGDALFHFDIFLKPQTYAVLLSFLFIQLFDATATLISVAEKSQMIDENGNLINSTNAMLADCCGSTVASIIGVCPVSTLAESNIALECGGRTGLVSVSCGILFFISILLYPIFSVFSCGSVTCLALVAVGSMMFSKIKDFDFNDKISMFTGFIIILISILTYSISAGLGNGIIMYCIMMLVAGRRKEVNGLTYGLALFFIANYIITALVL